MSSFTETADIETASEGYATRFSGEIGEWFLEIQQEITLSMIQKETTESILDVGGGHGQLARPLVRSGYPVTVIGSDTKCSDRLSDLSQHRSYSFLTGDLINLPFEDRSFDCVISFRLVPHCAQWKKLIAELCRVARKQVIIDYPPLFSSNFLYKILFPLKLALEGNTRTYEIFKDRDVLKEFELHGFSLHKRTPEFFLPMVFHRKLKNRKLSSLIEKIFRIFGLTGLLGSPTILSCKRAS